MATLGGGFTVIKRWSGKKPFVASGGPANGLNHSSCILSQQGGFKFVFASGDLFNQRNRFMFRHCVLAFIPVYPGHCQVVLWCALLIRWQVLAKASGLVEPF